MSVAAIILAAGQGLRAGGTLPKQFMPLPGGIPVNRVVTTFLQHPDINLIRVVVAPQDEGKACNALDLLGNSFPTKILKEQLLPLTMGATTRQASALAGLQSLREHAPSHVLIHDAARPFFKPEMIDEVLAALGPAEAVLPTVAVTDCVWRDDTDSSQPNPVPREHLQLAQTPQGFVYKKILDAHIQYADHQVADDASIARLAGMKIQMISGDPDNRN